MLIRPGDLDDPRVVALLHAHLRGAQAESPPESVHALDLDGLRSPDIALWTVWDGEALLGVGALRRLTPEHGEVKSMHTAEVARGRGAGSAMLRHIIADARAAGFHRLSLETGTAAYFAPARGLYERHGFVPCPPFADYRHDPHSAFYTLALGDALVEADRCSTSAEIEKLRNEGRRY